MIETTSAPKHSPKVLIIAAAAVGGLFMGGLMFSMVMDMHRMTGAVVGMAQNVGHMTSDMTVMRKQFEAMTATVKAMNHSLNDLEINMVDMTASVISMDNNMTDLEGDIKEIQQSIARDMSGIREDVRVMAGNVVGMNAKMGQMGVDIHRGSSSFTNPFTYMNNMMRPGP